MKAPSHPIASPIDVTNRSGGGTLESFTGGRSIAVFNLGLDISPLRPRQRYVVRALLQRLTRSTLPLPGEPRL
ncbi:MAG: hypothetical protein DVB25_01375 [Verrucomicrobia bacterium]|nr:MAG: hypothetical protein DVB25_01375 [Verrucomicrobiota bacterium]